MKKYTLDVLKNLIGQALEEQPTGDSWLDSRYNEQVHWIGHTNPYYKLFYLLARELQPELVIELGSWQATGAAHFAAGYPAGNVITIDIHREDKNAQTRAIEAAGHYDNLTYLNRWTWDAVEYIQQLQTPISILYIDAWHEYQYAKREWDLYQPLLGKPSLVICDDIMNNGGIFADMEQFWAEMPEPKFLDSQLHRGIPMGFVYNEEPEHVEQDRGIDSALPVRTGKRGRPNKKS